MPRKQKSPAPQTSLALTLDKNRCHFSTIDGRRCRMQRAKRHKSFCLLHAQQEEQILDAEAVAEELIGPVEDYQTAITVNRTLGCLFNLIAQKRISRQDGALLAYIGQMMLNSVGSTVKEEFLRMSGDRVPCRWRANVRRAAEILANDYSLKHAEESDEDEEVEMEVEAQPEEVAAINEAQESPTEVPTEAPKEDPQVTRKRPLELKPGMPETKAAWEELVNEGKPLVTSP